MVLTQFSLWNLESNPALQKAALPNLPLAFCLSRANTLLASALTQHYCTGPSDCQPFGAFADPWHSTWHSLRLLSEAQSDRASLHPADRGLGAPGGICGVVGGGHTCDQSAILLGCGQPRCGGNEWCQLDRRCLRERLRAQLSHGQGNSNW